LAGQTDRLVKVLLENFRLLHDLVEGKGRKGPAVEFGELGEGLDPG
jgi:hypothetical protein